MREKNQFSSWISRLHELDWDYEGDQSDSLFSSLHFHPGRFISQIPAALIGRFTVPGSIILDPYCGSGTTLVEAQRLGRQAIGIDINPIAALISSAKTKPVRAVRIRALLNSHIQRLLSQSLENSVVIGTNIDNIPASVQLAKWYHPHTGAELVFIWKYIQGCKGTGRQLLDFCFSTILMSACSETRHWGYVCDNTRPLNYKYVDAFALFESTVLQLIKAYEDRDNSLLEGQKLPLPSVTVIKNDAVHALRTLSKNTVDLVVTSPPYYGVIDYVKAQRLGMEWSGLSIEVARQQETGARSKRARLTAREDYLNEIREVFTEVARVMKKDSFCCMVFGQSVRRDDCLNDISIHLHEVGLPIVFKAERAISAGRRQTPHLSEEYLLVSQKK